MDPLAFLSDVEDDEDPTDGAPSSSPPPAQENAIDGPPAKRAKVDIDFAALQQVGYLVTTSEDADRDAAAASLNSTFAALEQSSKQAERLLRPEPEKPAPKPYYDEEAGCEPPPDSIETYDEGGAEVPAAWETFESAEEGLTKEVVDVMREAGFAKPTPIQAHTWPIVCAGRDLIGVAKT
eukprot:6225940-Amphidinium_carterae.1